MMMMMMMIAHWESFWRTSLTWSNWSKVGWLNKTLKQ